MGAKKIKNFNFGLHDLKYLYVKTGYIYLQGCFRLWRVESVLILYLKKISKIKAWFTAQVKNIFFLREGGILLKF